MAEKLTIQPDRCKSCAYCVKACPKAALSIGKASNKAGYRYVVAELEKCIACGSCYTVCPDYVFTLK